MKEEKQVTQADIDGAEVKLQPIAGIPPRIYIPAAYSALLAAVIFLVFVLPGITRFGSRIEFSGAPGKSAVFVGEEYRGSTTAGIFLKAGTYAIRIEHEGFLPFTVETRVGGRRFGSLFFPKRRTVSYSLAPGNSKAFLQSAFSSYAGWSLAGKPSALYQIPMALSDAVSALASTASLGAASGSLQERRRLMGDIFAVSASAEAARDGLKAATLVATTGLSGPLSLAAGLREVLSAAGSAPAAAVWLNDILPKSNKPARKSVSELSARIGQKPKSPTPGAPRRSGSQSVAGIRFSMFSPGRIVLGGEAPSGSFAPYTASLPEFGLAETETTFGQWKQFLAANPEWRIENQKTLAETGLVDDSYINGPASNPEASSVADAMPVTGVSWHAAKAYCDWLTSRSGGSYLATLPSEAMWESAAAIQDAGFKAVWSDVSPAGARNVGSFGTASNGLADLFGNVWEWTSDSFRSYPALSGYYLEHGEKAVRGGSWANTAADIDAGTRGGIAAEHGSAFLGFRPAIVKK